MIDLLVRSSETLLSLFHIAVIDYARGPSNVEIVLDTKREFENRQVFRKREPPASVFSIFQVFNSKRHRSVLVTVYQINLAQSLCVA